MSRASMLIVGVAWACLTLQVVADSGRAGDARASAVASSSDLMPVAQQNALVQKHCVGCHKGATPGGGLSLEAFDAARPDPSVAGMMLVKITSDGAMYQLTLACSGATRRGEMQLATFTKAGADAPMTIRAMSARADGTVPFTYALDGGVSQPATLRATQEHSGTAQETMLLPSRALAVRGLYPKENVSFEFAGLSPTVRHVLATCFTAPPANP